MYYKIVLDDTIIDVAASPLQVCKYIEASQMILRCNENADPNGYISDRTGEIYSVDGWSSFPEGTETGGTVELTEIDEETYTALKEELDAGEEIVNPDDPEPEPDPEPEEPDAPKTRIQRLEEEVAELEAQNALLIGMLLENREDGMTASKAYSVGDLIVVGGTLYKVISGIANGAALTVGTNVTQTTIAAEIAAVNL